MGWSRPGSMPDSLLLHAAPAVLEAPKQRQIQVGHAELLAGLPEATQTGTLAKIVGDRITVADLKARIKGFALDLSVAIFDQTECATCPHHSSQQAALFAEAVEGDVARTGRATTRKPKPRWWPARPNWKPRILGISRHRTRARPLRGIVRERSPKESASANSPPVRVLPLLCGVPVQPARPEGVLQAPLCVNLTATARKWPPRAARRPRHPPLVAHPPPPATATPAGAPSRQRPHRPVDAHPKKVEAWVDDWFAATSRTHRDPTTRFTAGVAAAGAVPRGRTTGRGAGRGGSLRSVPRRRGPH